MRMFEAIVPSLISAAAALIVCMLNNRTQHAKTEAQYEKTQALIEYKINELTARVDKHNNVIERTYKLEQTSAVQEKEMKVVNHRIEDLERMVQK